MRAGLWLRRVKTSGMGCAIALSMVACGGTAEPIDTIVDDTIVTDTVAPSDTSAPTETSGPEPVAALPDGDYLAFVIVGEDETGETTLGVDVAEMLTGEEAREAAVEDGIIEDGEDLPNDFYIDNPESRFELLHVAPDASIELISGDDTARMVELELADLVAVFEGTYVGESIYGVVAHEEIVMNVTVADGEITGLEQVYLP